MWEKLMQRTKDQTRQGNPCMLVVLSIGAAVFCFAFLAAHLWFDKRAFEVDNTVLILLFGGLAFLFLPFFSRIKIGDFLEAERLQTRIEQVNEIVVRGEVVQSKDGGKYYIGSDERSHSLPDDETANFFTTPKGVLPVLDRILNAYPFAGTLDSVRSCPIVHWNAHLFAILNGKKYHIGSASLLADWGRSASEYEEWDDDRIKLVPTGR